jgi:hypothetical protein
MISTVLMSGSQSNLVVRRSIRPFDRHQAASYYLMPVVLSKYLLRFFSISPLGIVFAPLVVMECSNPSTATMNEAGGRQLPHAKPYASTTAAPAFFLF